MVYYPLFTDFDKKRNIADGKSRTEIADELGISVQTVSHYFRFLALKLRCVSANNILLKALKLGLVTITPYNSEVE